MDRRRGAQTGARAGLAEAARQAALAALRWQAALAARKHAIRISTRQWGNMQAVFKAAQTGEARAASDPRGLDVGWY